MNGVLWVLGTGAQWRELGQIPTVPDVPSPVSSSGCGKDKLERILRVLAEELHARGRLRVEEAFIDASFTGAKKGASRSVPRAVAKAPRSSLLPMVTVFL